jgi:methylated-DNA-protein-cysteine methyltransferase-like protein
VGKKAKTDQGDASAERASTQWGRAGEARSQKTGMDRVFGRIYKMVLRIPKGRVMTYGQIAYLLEDRYSARLVGWAMHSTPHDERNIPWHRVINARGATSTGKVIPHNPDLQRSLLEAEGVVFDEGGHCDLKVYQWSPRRSSPSVALQRPARGTQPAGHRQATIAKLGPVGTKKAAGARALTKSHKTQKRKIH